MTDSDKIIQVIAEGAAAYEGVTYSMFPKPFNEQAIRILDALEKAGMAVVPVEPTEAMHDAARDWSLLRYGKAIGIDASKGCWGTMLAASKETER